MADEPLDNLIDGRAIAGLIHEETRQAIARLLEGGLQSGLAFVRVGEDPASRVYVGMKEKTCLNLGIHSKIHVLPGDTTASSSKHHCRGTSTARRFLTPSRPAKTSTAFTPSTWANCSWATPMDLCPAPPPV